ncbi:aldehyde dehydrogenase family protein [Methanoplanus limicola]|uniref:Aldehyde Dehydrogenase n=1 Tax=Methanoplanus limicola DSM 2279 TaxID=937775 RepID=H1YYS3_9EURY|nr:aldehyde dehydrogenase family protein [Methanoplanus limicola]EHQ36995.1 Aldehyde Dehydrogenase [Methanoplanus limicola DSM 2279]
MNEKEPDIIEIINPATGERAGTVNRCTKEDVHSAIDGAEDAFSGWAAKSPRERGKMLFLAAQEIRNKQVGLAELLTAEQGKPLSEAKNEIQGCAAVLEYYSSISGTVRGDFLPKSDYGYSFTVKKPLGICGAIIPWNMPVLIMAWKTGPALVAGNCLIVKPSSKTPLTSLKIASILHRCGIPEDVLPVVTGSGSEAGSALAESRKIAALSFTGSAETGNFVEKLSCGTGKRLTLELGGSDPMIVCRDADVDSAVAGAVAGRFYNCGQTCTAVKRLYVMEDIAEEFKRKLTEKVSQIKTGNGMMKGTKMGPLIDMEARDKTAGVIAGIQEDYDAEILTGGEIPDSPDLKCGSFLEPTVITGAPKDCTLFTEEIFGPVLPVAVVKNMDEAIEEANRTKFGLGASVWTTSLKNSFEASEMLDAGIVWVNRHLKIPPEVPFGGEKESGSGRENGLCALERYMKEKTVIMTP